MHIKEVYIDGFKSYASRTVLNGFDKSFNAITGLNGSGKSNILDAICFVLGISNLSQVRANNLTELIYKQGQAGITKASVSVIFDNSDLSNSPIGYEDQSTITVQRQIMIGGKNKYMINGRNAQLNRVQNLFHSVQLNVNNPHFLIMQGRITKVLNMKPIEILGMIEEASGTRMFELKKNSAQKTIIKKDKKLEEIEKILSEEITPKLEKLKNERAKCLQHEEVLVQLKTLERYFSAYEYHSYKKQIEKLEKDQQTLKEKIEGIRKEILRHQSEEDELQKKIDTLKNQKQSKMRQDLNNLHNSVSTLNKELIQKRSELESKKEELERETRNLEDLKQQINEETREKEDLSIKYSEAKSKSEELKKKIEDINNRIENLKKQHEAVAAGVAVNIDDGDGKTLTEQIMDCKKQIASLKTKKEKNSMTITHLKKSLEEKTEIIKTQTNGDAQILEKSKHSLETAKKHLEELKFSEETFKQTEKEILNVEALIQEKKIHVGQLKNSLPHVFFDIDMRNISGQVLGTIANLFRTKDKKYISALEICAGPKINHLVVDTEQTAKDVLQKGGVRRITTIPLNNIVYSRKFEKKELVDYAEKKNAQLALNLITYDNNVENAMKYCFGSTLVAENMDTAKQVAFDKDIQTRTITLDGDMFEPSGTLTGGSRKLNLDTSTLVKIEKLLLLEEELVVLTKKKQQLEPQLNTQLRDQYNSLLDDISMKKRAYNLAESRAQKSSYTETKKSIELMQREIESLQKSQELCSEELKVKQKDIVELEKQQEIFNKHSNEESLKQHKQELIASNIKKARTELETVKKTLKGIESEKMLLRMQQIEEGIVDLNNQYEQKKEAVSSLEQFYSELTDMVKKLEKDFKENNMKLSESNSAYSKSDEEINKLNNKKEEISRASHEAKLGIKNFEHEVSKITKSHESISSEVKKIIATNKWIRKEEENFDKEGTEFHFSKDKETLQTCKQRLAKMKETCENLSKTINKKAMALYAKTEDEYTELVKKKEIVEADKKKIGEVIEDLDERKKKTIEDTWQKVDEYFRSIFSMLLVGASAKLEPPSDATNGPLDGLEVKVAFNGAWKESLTELSGGQRSLLALSLILALLRFKPAPVYILDEIDAALDPSHTQNIGRMLKQHFTNSQFIVVSLKEGMFQNANVLFKTKFVNGSSTVSRVTNHTSAVESEEEQPSSSNSTPQLVGKRGTKRKHNNHDEEYEDE